ncbi:unnamed protein product [Phytophthora fragariaefolia]|uniref:Unnamed protein product n=1 Tax=Phytophthora fragariaefolia TaxID=1490495 RepID=A0A9W7D8H5_9STRA|nr:unnamed protein product [Phytophthora fragariaefolia]
MDKWPTPGSGPLLVASDDSATLEAALKFLDNCEHEPLVEPEDGDVVATFDDISSLLERADIAQPSPDAHDPNEATARSNAEAETTQTKRRRTTPKQEIAQLRAQERELASRLELLRLQAYDQKQRNGDGKNGAVLPFWKKMASRQHQSRLDAERENRRLRSLVAMHVGRAKRLKIALTKQKETEVGRPIRAACPQVVVDTGCLVVQEHREQVAARGQLDNGISQADTGAVLVELEMEADEVYANLGAFIRGDREQLKSQAKFLEHSDTYTLPFDRLTVGTSMWHALAARFSAHKVLEHSRYCLFSSKCETLRANLLLYLHS